MGLGLGPGLGLGFGFGLGLGLGVGVGVGLGLGFRLGSGLRHELNWLVLSRSWASRSGSVNWQLACISRSGWQLACISRPGALGRPRAPWVATTGNGPAGAAGAGKCASAYGGADAYGDAISKEIRSSSASRYVASDPAWLGLGLGLGSGRGLGLGSGLGLGLG